MSSLTLSALGLPDTPNHHLSVDGMSPLGPNLSHWPGNRTPAVWKADLSTGICLRFARAPRFKQEAFLDGATAALNDHYDTDGFGSLLAVLRPEVALPRETALLAAAAAGDYQSFGGWKGFAVDRVVAGLAGPGGPMEAACAGKNGPEKNLLRYAWLMEHGAELLDRPEQFESIYRDELARVEQDLAAPSTTVERFPDAGMAWIRSAGPVHRMALNKLAGDCYRVLHTVGDAAEVRFHDRTESWFEVVTFAPPARVDLEPLRCELEARETELGHRGGHGTAPPEPTDSSAEGNTPRWCLDPLDQPVPELYRGPPSAQEYGIVSRTLTPSRISSEELASRFCAHLKVHQA